MHATIGGVIRDLVFDVPCPLVPERSGTFLNTSDSVFCPSVWLSYGRTSLNDDPFSAFLDPILYVDNGWFLIRLRMDRRLVQIVFVQALYESLGRPACFFMDACWGRPCVPSTVRTVRSDDSL